MQWVFQLTRWNYNPVYFELFNSITFDRNTMRNFCWYQEYWTLHWTMNDEVVYLIERVDFLRSIFFVNILWVIRSTKMWVSFTYINAIDVWYYQFISVRDTTLSITTKDNAEIRSGDPRARTPTPTLTPPPCSASQELTLNVEIFAWGVIFAFLSSSRKLPHAKIKPICIYEGNRSSIVKITPTWNVLPTFSRNFPPAKITTFTVTTPPSPLPNWISPSPMYHLINNLKTCSNIWKYIHLFQDIFKRIVETLIQLKDLNLIFQKYLW